MLNFFKNRKLKRERETLYRDILSFVRGNYQYKQIENSLYRLFLLHLQKRTPKAAAFQNGLKKNIKTMHCLQHIPLLLMKTLVSNSVCRTLFVNLLRLRRL